MPDDTLAAIRRKRIAGLRAMTAAQRLELTMAMFHTAEELAFAGMRLRHGALPLHELRRRLATQRYGAQLVQRVEAYRAAHDRAAR